ncbi:hypothetical protein GIB67_028774 [Kingdonia uniflora]|uniref:Uncharacterized protein n=1 Tax=Kingdonia uniflora TaxID=39325 RepID=A0A7J7M256_9MAGN|nr:hypothetical protein GIB67_028774 [Kingdonia uniflora]
MKSQNILTGAGCIVKVRLTTFTKFVQYVLRAVYTYLCYPTTRKVLYKNLVTFLSYYNIFWFVLQLCYFGFFYVSLFYFILFRDAILCLST